MTAALTPQTAKALRDLVASAIAGEKAYNVPAVCRRFGLADGTDEEAYRSKFTYVSSRTKELRSVQVLDLARAVQADMPSYPLGEMLAKIDERGQHLVTELTRRRIVTALDGVPLSGTLPAMEFLGVAARFVQNCTLSRCAICLGRAFSGYLIKGGIASVGFKSDQGMRMSATTG